MEFTVQIEGLDRLQRRLKITQQDVDKEVTKALYVSAKLVEGEAKKSIAGGGKSGRIYQKYNPRRTHQASAPGQAPATDTGRLVNSIHGESVPGKLESLVRAGSGIVRYARMLEFGTVRMAARPFLFPAFERSKAAIEQRIRKAVNIAIAKAGKK